MNTTTAANDTTATATLAIGETLETAEWRIHRFAHALSALHIANAGKRGKKCSKLVLVSSSVGYDTSEAMNAAAFSACGVANRGGSVDEMALLMEAHAGGRLEFYRHEERGVDVERANDKIEITGDRLSVRIERTSFWARDLNDKNNESTVISNKRAECAKVYAWAQKNIAAIQAMALRDFEAALSNLGVSGHYFCAMD